MMMLGFGLGLTSMATTAGDPLGDLLASSGAFARYSLAGVSESDQTVADATGQTPAATRGSSTSVDANDPAFGGGYASVNGTSTWLQLPPEAKPDVQGGAPNELTILLQIRPTATPAADGRIFSSESIAGRGVFLTFAGLGFRARFGDGTTTAMQLASSTFTVGQWSTIVVRFDGSDMDVWTAAGATAGASYAGHAAVTHANPRVGMYGNTATTGAGVPFDVRELILFDSAVDDATLAAINGLLPTP